MLRNHHICGLFRSFSLKVLLLSFISASEIKCLNLMYSSWHSNCELFWKVQIRREKKAWQPNWLEIFTNKWINTTTCLGQTLSLHLHSEFCWNLVILGIHWAVQTHSLYPGYLNWSRLAEAQPMKSVCHWVLLHYSLGWVDFLDTWVLSKTKMKMIQKRNAWWIINPINK